MGSNPTAVTTFFRTMSTKPPISEELRKKVGSLHRSLFARLRTYFFAGVLVTAPVAITVYLTYIFLRFMDNHVTDLLPPAYHSHTTIPGIGLIIAIGFFILVGWLTRNVIGRMLIWLSDYGFARMPVIRIVYGALKQIFETLMNSQSSAFREVVVFEYPKPGMWAIGFVTGTVQGKIQTLAEGEIVNVFRPFTPNPTSGFMLLIPRRDLMVLDMSVEDAIKLVVSGGMITPSSLKV